MLSRLILGILFFFFSVLKKSLLPEKVLIRFEGFRRLILPDRLADNTVELLNTQENHQSGQLPSKYYKEKLGLERGAHRKYNKYESY